MRLAVRQRKAGEDGARGGLCGLGFGCFYFRLLDFRRFGLRFFLRLFRLFLLFLNLRDQDGLHLLADESFASPG